MRPTGAVPRWGSVAAWGLVAVVAVVGVLGAFTIGAFLLPFAAIVAAGLAGLAARRADARSRSAAAAAPTPASPTPAGSDTTINPLATISMITGVASMVISPPLSIVGLVTGVVARRQIRRAPAPQAGSGRALAGIITSLLGMVVAAALFARVVAQ